MKLLLEFQWISFSILMMKTKQLKNTIFFLAITLSFFLGRESKTVISTYSVQPTYLSDSFKTVPQNSFDNSYTPLKMESGTDIVYRCGKSKIYHPTKAHGSFKNCKLKVYELTIKKAKELGLRHCKCAGNNANYTRN